MKYKISMGTFSCCFSNREDIILQHFFDYGYKKPDILFLEYFIRKHDIKNIVSLGSGMCVWEYLLKKRNPYLDVVCGEVDKCLVDIVKPLFPELCIRQFDYNCDSLKNLGDSFDLVFYFDSVGHIEDEGFVRIVSEMKELGVRWLLLFGGHYNYSWYIINRLFNIKSNRLKYNGNWRYVRSRNEFFKLYKKAGIKPVSMFSIPRYYRSFRQIDIFKLGEI